MESSEFNFRKLRSLRDEKPWTRSEMVEELRKRDFRSIDAQKLYRYENGEVTPKRDAIDAIAALFNVNADSFFESDAARRVIRLAVGPYPDHGFLSFCLSRSFSLVAEGKLGSEVREMHSSEVSVPYGQILERLAEGKEIDVALFNETTWARELNRPDGKRYADTIINLGPVVQFRGFSVLISPGHETAIKVLSQHQFEVGTDRDRGGVTSAGSLAERTHQLQNALSRTFSQLPVDVKVLVPKGTEMQHLLLALLELGQRASDELSASRLKLLTSRAEESELIDSEALTQFVNSIKKTEPAIYLGGLAHRQLAEAQGALELIGDDSMSQIASAMPVAESHVENLFRNSTQPRIILLMRRDFYDNWPEAVRLIERRWNLAVERLHSDGLFLEEVSDRVARKMIEWADKDIIEHWNTAPKTLFMDNVRLYHEIFLRWMPIIPKEK